MLRTASRACGALKARCRGAYRIEAEGPIAQMD